MVTRLHRSGSTGGQPVTLRFNGGHVTCHGCVWRMTVTTKEQDLELPCASVAVQVTGLLPSGKVEPLGGAQMVVIGGQVPDTLGAR